MTARRRVWGCVILVVLAIGIVTVAVRSGGNSNSGGSKPPAQPVAWKGAPVAFYALRDGQVWLVEPAPGGRRPSADSDSETNHPAVSLGSADGRRAYAALQSGACRTTFETHYWHTGGSVVAGLNTVGERVEPIAMAVSADGKQIAFVVDGVRVGHRCVPVTRLVVMNLVTHRSRSWSAPVTDTIKSVQWSPDGSQLAYLLAPKCADLSYSTSACRFSGGTYVLDLFAPPTGLGTGRKLLPLLGRNQGEIDGPVFWWRSQWATVFGGRLRAVTARGRLGPVLGSGLPATGIESISSTPDGNHVVISTTTATYRWDRGRLTEIPGGWTQPSW